ncbi:hypothetical protein EXIGLDRAFT_834936 [Exidia glandulosa HHB12029]|uniref:Uncharacterized protein n=1 Tax=Exidia glandulosa HHB12029 TaxID=1314781 RepID=A0A166ARM5_EXIGL|nr:hypothetical protein EXIGLDRAFT_834936 [Exidia glandulosa HHB12029]
MNAGQQIVLPRVLLRFGMGVAYVGEVLQTQTRPDASTGANHLWMDLYFLNDRMMTIDFTAMNARHQARYVDPSTPLTARPEA